MARTLAAMAAGRQRYDERMRALKAAGVIERMPWGRHRRPLKRSERRDLPSRKAEAIAAINRHEAEAREAGLLPALIGVRPASELTRPELLGEIGVLALAKLRHLLLKERQTDDTRVERFEFDLALGVAKLFSRVSENTLHSQRNDKLAEILAAIELEAEP
jgi:hypothetical protein